MTPSGPARPSRPSRPADPLAQTELLLVDATNLAHVLARASGGATAVALVARIRSLIPPAVTIELVFDGAAEPGMRGIRIASGVTVRYGGRQSADAVIVERVTAEARNAGPVGAAAILVVTDARELRDLVRVRGARTAGASWLASRLDRSGLAAPAAVGNPRPPAPSTGSGHDRGRGNDDGRDVDGEGDGDENARPGWKAGRGATTKRGNPRRKARGARRPPG
ncbi:MAG: NYN domain-containing protein [Chloroflexota bacterium]